MQSVATKYPHEYSASDTRDGNGEEGGSAVWQLLPILLADLKKQAVHIQRQGT